MTERHTLSTNTLDTHTRLGPVFIRIPIDVISVGSDRRETLKQRWEINFDGDSFADEWIMDI